MAPQLYSLRLMGPASGWLHRAATTCRSLQWEDNKPVSFPLNNTSIFWSSRSPKPNIHSEKHLKSHCSNEATG